MSNYSLNERFPEMKPINSPPSLSTINGLGLMAYGGRDHDPETGTYVKTHCLVVLFIPILALGAYRVADAPSGGWYFLGKVPLSGFARFWNWLVLGGTVCGIALALWLQHTSTPEYAAGQKMAEADSLAEARQIGQAAKLYAAVANGGTRQAPAAVEKINALLDTSAEATAPDEAAEAFRVAVNLNPRWEHKLPRLYERGVQLADAYAKDRPAGALLVLDALARVAPDAADLAGKQAAALEKLVAAEPTNVAHACRLALAYEARRDLARCEKLLAPLGQKLDGSEGARLLGVIRLRQGKLDEAERLLTSYAEPRLSRVQNLGRDLDEAARGLEQRAVNELNARNAVGFDYQRYARADKEEQQKMVSAYILARFKEDDTVRQAREAVAQERHAVEATLDLGMLVLLRAQKLPDDQRGAALGKAEKLFLAVRGAGPVDEVDLNLGEVYYWLGKQSEGKKLFEGLLKARGRDALMLLRVGRALRRVGENSEARRLSEEAYQRAGEARDKQEAADLRAVLGTDLEDRIKWLQRANTAQPRVQADLSVARGQQAARDGKDAEAIQHFRAAVGIYEGLPLNAATLNNSALVYADLYRLSGDRADFERVTRLMDRALAEKPGDSIVLQNAASFVLEAVVSDVLRQDLDLKVLRGLTGLHLLPYLYADPAGRARVAERLRAHPAFARAVQHYERLLILAPRDPVAPSALAGLYAVTRDVPALRRLDERMHKAELDLEYATQEMLNVYQGKNLQKQRAQHTTRVAQRRKTLEAARKAGGINLAVAAGELVYELSNAAGLELPLDADELVRLAEEADKAAPSRGTRLSLVRALLIRAGRTLAAQDKGYAAWAAKVRRALAPSYHIALALSDSAELRGVVLQNADVRRAIEVERGQSRIFPDEVSPWAWAMLKAAHPEEAARLAKALETDELGRILRSLADRLGPINAQVVVLDYWALRMTGNEAEAREALRRAAARGVPLPFDVK